MNNIIVLTDFSVNAFHATEYACVVAKKVNAKRLTLLHTFDASLIFGPNETSALLGAVEASGVYNNYEWVVEESEHMNKENKKELDNWISILKEKTGPETELRYRIENGQLHDTINRVCKEEKADLVVIGFKGKTGIEKMLLGSNTAKAIDSVNYPLLIVPADAALKAPEKVVLAVDLKKVKQKYTALILKYLVQGLGCHVSVLHVCNKTLTAEKKQEYTSQIRNFLGDINMGIHFAQDADVVNGISKFAKAENAAMIIALHHSYGFFTGLFHKSISKELALHSNMPMLVLHTTL